MFWAFGFLLTVFLKPFLALLFVFLLLTLGLLFVFGFFLTSSWVSIPVIDLIQLIIPSYFFLGILGGLIEPTNGFVFLIFLLSRQFISGSGLGGVRLYESVFLISEDLTLTTL